MSKKGHVEPRNNKNKDQAIVGRRDELLPVQQKKHFDPIELKSKQKPGEQFPNKS